MTAADSTQVLPLSSLTRSTGRGARKTTSIKDRITIDKLRGMSFVELERLYRQLSPPDTLSVLNGRKKGSLLVVAGLHRTPAGLLIKALGKTSFFPWKGKNFTARSLIKGSGINRINLTISRQEWFAFQSGFKSSLVDGRPCIHLNYRLKGNHWLVRHLTDEMREVGPGLYLGTSFIQLGKGRINLLYFTISE